MYTRFKFVLPVLSIACLTSAFSVHAQESAAPAEAVVEEAQPIAQSQPESPDAPPVVLNLRSAQEEALHNNPTLQAVELRVRQAHQKVVQARSAYFPQATATYRATHTELPDNAVDGLRLQAAGQVLPNAALSSRFGLLGNINPVTSGANAAYSLARGIRTALSIPDDQESYELSLQLNYLLFDGLSREFTHRAAKFGEAETDAAHRDLQRQILFAVAQGYYAIQLAKENITIAEADAAFNARLLKEVQLGKEAGIASLSDVLNFEVRARAAESNLIAAEGGLKEARVQLAALLGKADAELPDTLDIAPLPEETASDLELPDPDSVIARAVEHRPDLEQARLSVQRSQALANAARGSFLPRVGVFAARSSQLSTSDTPESDDFATTVGLNVSYDLFTGGRNYSRFKEAKLAKKQTERELDQAELDALSQVRRAWISLEEAQQQLVLQRTTAELVSKNRDLVEKEYAAGQAALVRLNEAQRDLVAAQSRLALARVGLFLAHYELRTATGESLLDFSID